MSWLWTSILLCPWAIFYLGCPRFWSTKAWPFSFTFALISGLGVSSSLLTGLLEGVIISFFFFFFSGLSALAIPLHIQPSFPYYQNHFFKILCFFNLPSHKLAKESDLVLNTVIKSPWGVGKYLDTLWLELDAFRCVGCFGEGEQVVDYRLHQIQQ